jgi:hypothetical protein
MHKNLVMISDCLKHDSILVNTFQQHPKKFVENTLESTLKKKFTSLMGLQPNIKTKYSWKIIWHDKDCLECQQCGSSFVTSHGKSAYDGIGGTLKRLAAKGSMQQPHTDQKYISCMNGLNPVYTTSILIL